MTLYLDALEGIYTSLSKDNEELDVKITDLKGAMTAESVASVEMDPLKIPQNNRQGRKLLIAYFRQRGVKVVFSS
jgi:hypothetical protein